MNCGHYCLPLSIPPTNGLPERCHTHRNVNVAVSSPFQEHLDSGRRLYSMSLGVIGPALRAEHGSSGFVSCNCWLRTDAASQLPIHRPINTAFLWPATGALIDDILLHG
jgi:hypothetical protein